MIRTVGMLALLLCFSALAAHAGTNVPAYHSDYDFLPTSPGAMGYGLYGYVNPALVKQVDRPSILFAWADESGKFNDLKKWGLFTSMGSALGFGVIRDEQEAGGITDYRLSMAFGDHRSSFGIGYGWSTGDTDVMNRGSVVTVGTITRPMPSLSLGMSGTFATEGSSREGVLDLAVRPFGNEVVSVFGDYAIRDEQRMGDGTWSSGVALELLPGMRLTGRYFDTETFTVGLNLSFGHMGLMSQAAYDKEGNHGYNTYGVRVGGRDRSFIWDMSRRDKDYMELDLKGQTKYQRFRLFDRSRTLKDLLDAIDAAKEDDSVAGIAINMSDMAMPWEMAWEVREKLREFKATGKHVVIFAEDLGITTYHFASVADKIVLDPIGDFTLQGFRAGSPYLKGTLEKLGIGFDEWRFFAYKSAYEVFSRDSMSEGQREQLQEIIDDFYLLAKTETCEGRGIDPDEYDRLVNKEVFLLPEEALELGLVDTLGHWEAVKKVIEGLEGKSKTMVGPGALARYQLPGDNYWGRKPQIAVLYALGVCAMDEGIRARSLSKVIDRVAGDREVKAVVFRVDSPGGSALASDIVAEALKRCQEKKPVIVSQGYVAGSGGYWISMYCDTIVAAPNTITGSIGVIGGWFYNNGLKEKLGVTTDLVKVGDHADLGFGISLPLVGRIPDRNLTTEERAKIEHGIRFYYDEFVKKVASGRHMEYDQVAAIAQGRVWSGYDGLDIGLVDVLGGLDTAIMIAKESAGIAPDEEVDIVELPKAPLFDASIFMPKLFGVEYQKNDLIEHLRFRLEHNGEPMPILPMEYLSLGAQPGSGLAF